jgi:hypothetical protein
VGLDIRAISSGNSVVLRLGARRIKPSFRFIIFNFIKKPAAVPVDGILIRHHRQYLFVVGNTYFMQKLTLITISIILTHFASGQNLQLDIHGNRLRDFINLEKSLDSKNVKSESNYVSERGVAQPEIYRRKEEKVPDLLSYYFYYEKDSTINYILYEWDESNFAGFKENATKTNAEIANFIEKYNQLYTQVAAKYGKSEQKGDLTDISLAEKGMTRTDNWRPNDSTEIEMYTTLSNKYEKKGAVTTNPTYRIRLYIRNTKTTNTEAQMQLSEEKVKTLDSTSQAFFSAMKSKNFEQSKSYLSMLISKNVTNAQLEQLSQAVRFGDNLELFFKGVQNGLGGSAFYILQYKYSSETNNPPKEMIKMVFDDSNKIAGIQPMRRN